jgi:hypothetical protein
LKDAVCHNLLFRTLESKQIDQVLDAMWEKTVKQGETIIQQGRISLLGFHKKIKSYFFQVMVVIIFMLLIMVSMTSMYQKKKIFVIQLKLANIIK